MIFSNPSVKKEVVTSIRRTAMTKSDDKEVVGFLSILPYDFSLNSDEITSNLLMEGREKLRRSQRDRKILGEIFG